jgi:SAM-dependent methyltransferase
MKTAVAGERLDTNVINETVIEHLHRYALALELAKGKRVLDIASGEGYGTNLIASVAKSVIGADLSEATIANARKKYKNNNNLDFVVGDATKLPFESNTFDLVVSFETIEHHDQHEMMLSEIKRVLTDDGTLIMSTPDKYQYSDIPNYRNPYHVKEPYENEYKSLISSFFEYNIFLGQRLGLCSFIFSDDDSKIKNEAYTGGYDGIKKMENWGPVYWISISSRRPIGTFEGLGFYYADFIMDQKIASFKRKTQYRLGSFIHKIFFLKQIRIIYNKLFGGNN